MRWYLLFLLSVGISACNPSFKGHDDPASNSKDTPIPQKKMERPKLDTLKKKAKSRVTDTLRPQMAKL